MSNFRKLMDAERQALLEQRQKLVGDKERIESKINDVDVELAAMSAFDVTKTKLVKLSSNKTPTKAAVQAVVKSAARVKKKPTRRAAKPAAKVEAAPAQAAQPAPSSAKPAAKRKPAARKAAARKPAAAKAAAKPAAKTAAKPAAAKAAASKAAAPKAAAKTATKAGAARPARKPQAAASTPRDKLMTLLEKHPQGLKRGDILTKLRVKGNKKQETSISNILADMKKKSTVKLDNGIYIAAQAKANGAAHA